MPELVKNKYFSSAVPIYFRWGSLDSLTIFIINKNGRKIKYDQKSNKHE